MKRRARRLSTPHGAPQELYDADAEVWHDQRRYRAFLAANGLEGAMPAAERMGGAAHPRNRRRSAAGAWAHDNDYGRDWNRLREMGLIA